MEIEYLDGKIILDKDDFIGLLADSEQLNALLAEGLADWERYPSAVQSALDFEQAENFEQVAARRLKELTRKGKQ